MIQEIALRAEKNAHWTLEYLISVDTFSSNLLTVAAAEERTDLEGQPGAACYLKFPEGRASTGVGKNLLRQEGQQHPLPLSQEKQNQKASEKE